MKLYFLRHAPTAANLTGTMVQDYDREPIVGTMPEHWQEDIGQYLPKIDINTPVISSPAKRISAYDVINSNGFKFYNLDLLVYDTGTKEIKDYHNRDHITHF